MLTTTTAREATMVTCPGLCGGKCGAEQVAAFGLIEFEATTVEVSACSALLAQGWEGPQEVLRKSQADRLFPAEAMVRHADGLVWFRA
jgi:hypothetical protein